MSVHQITKSLLNIFITQAQDILAHPKSLMLECPLSN